LRLFGFINPLLRGVGVCDNHPRKGFLTHPLPPLKRGEYQSKIKEKEKYEKTKNAEDAWCISDAAECDRKQGTRENLPEQGVGMLAGGKE
jgi:hypothetical protein